MGTEIQTSCSGVGAPEEEAENHCCMKRRFHRLGAWFIVNHRTWKSEGLSSTAGAVYTARDLQEVWRNFAGCLIWDLVELRVFGGR